jgi:membrane dipeptidase
MEELGQIPVFDGHNDVILCNYLPQEESRSLLIKSEEGHIDLPRAIKGAFKGGLFAIFVPPDSDLDGFSKGLTPELIKILEQPLETAFSQKYAQMGIDALRALETESEGAIRIVTDYNNLKISFDQNAITIVIHFEGAEPIAENLENLQFYYDQGLRSIGLVWSRPNLFGKGVPFEINTKPDTGDGLTEAGKALVKACNQMGIVVDLSHLNEKGFWDVEKITSAPLTATHSCVYRISPISRNLLDKQFDAIKASNGIVGLNFGVEFIREDCARNTDTPIKALVRHIRYMADFMGIDHVGFGSDFDGTQIPDELKDAAGLPKLVRALYEDGFHQADIEKIAYKNWFRVLKDTWK